MCNPNSTIAAYRRRAQAQQLLELQTGAVSAQYLMANSLNESALATQTRETVAPVQMDNSMVAVAAASSSMGKVDYTNPSYGIPTTFSTLQSYQLARSANTPKPKPKRRRKPQKPGKTAKQNDRHFVVHNYHDHANDKEEDEQADSTERRGGVSISFPIKLHTILDQVEADGLGHIISWQPHGRCFVIHKPKEFADHIMPGYFRQTKLTSFQRQLNLYGFNRITRGDDSGGYYHELFLRGKPFLCHRMVRTKVKGTRFKAASSPDQEPNFYLMPPVKLPTHVTPHNSDCDNSDDGYNNQMYGRESMAPTPFASTQQQEVWRRSFQEQLPRTAATIVENAANYSPLASVSRSLIHPSLAAAAAARLPSPSKYQVPQMPQMLPNQNSLDDGEIGDLLLEGSFSQDSVNTNSNAQEAVDFSNIFDPIGDNTLSSDAELSRVLCRLLD
mmetsp:Transcript_1004/g.1947  ORF Transcript_1004/g.1947 Transcript_1004/m.1947 type:complete len:444 (+) Transcript_1004:244-1575(+)|eukprot:CAMPEP_0113623556 /NCGR_PEP_ID=MMETSP0017_2-20120614/12121_1 /TAXON_ID=2856 /ORGANISM="Cylindrotheca closterium" /LENGTH=443 /DNA_ID=CAMNT_0000533515 /DNA_START=112 /DNA_END=1443 /DNA_ORIENTATION=- /assembly_acc=CAM_ASM_000147